MTDEEMRAVCLRIVAGEIMVLGHETIPEPALHTALREGRLARTTYGFDVQDPASEHGGHYSVSDEGEGVWAYTYADVSGAGDTSYLLADGSVLMAGYPGWDEMNDAMNAKWQAP